MSFECQCLYKCEFGDDASPPELKHDRHLETCREVSWERVAEIIQDIEFLQNHDDLVSVYHRWLADVVLPSWKGSHAKYDLERETFGLISQVVHRVHSGNMTRMEVKETYTPAFKFVMKHPAEIRRGTARVLWLKMPRPVGWIAASRSHDGKYSHMCNGKRVIVCPLTLQESEYGKLWAEEVDPEPQPPFMDPNSLIKVPLENRHWYVYSAGINGWVAAYWKDNAWYQYFNGRSDFVNKVTDADGSFNYGPCYGKTCGVVVPLYSEEDDRVYDRLVLHPTYKMKWIGVFIGPDGQYYTYSYPNKVQVEVDVDPLKYNVTWRWPPHKPAKKL